MSAERSLPDFTLKQKVGRRIGAVMMVGGMLIAGWNGWEVYPLVSNSDNTQAKQETDAKIPPIDEEIVQKASVLTKNYELQASKAAIEAAKANLPQIPVENHEELYNSYQILEQRQAHDRLYGELYTRPLLLKVLPYEFTMMMGLMSAVLGSFTRTIASRRYRH